MMRNLKSNFISLPANHTFVYERKVEPRCTFSSPIIKMLLFAMVVTAAIALAGKQDMALISSPLLIANGSNNFNYRLH